MSRVPLLVIGRDGKALQIAGPEPTLIFAAYADHHVRVSKRRASHVEPDNIVLRKIFHMIRAHFGEEGKMATFTRKWPCLWRVNMIPSGGPVLTGRWRSRKMALASEVEWLRQQLFGQLN